MGVDYYYLLEINAGANHETIQRAYRRLALKYHPLRNKNKPDTSEAFYWISEAYEVLIDPRLRARYDQYGEEGLKLGAPYSDHQPIKYLYHGDPYRTFQNYFGGPNPFKEINKEMELNEFENFGRKDGRGQPKKGDPVRIDLVLSLEDIYNGCTKKTKMIHRVMDKDCHTTVIEEKTHTILVRPGWRENTEITFKEDGDQGPNIIPGDIIYVLKAMEHKDFRRKGIDLHHTAKIPLGQAILGVVIDINTLDGRSLHVPITEIITPDYVKLVEGEGMPDSCEPGKKGNLYIDFDIQYPKRLTDIERLGVEAALFRDGVILEYV